jgi:hypothetical protein
VIRLVVVLVAPVDLVIRLVVALVDLVILLVVQEALVGPVIRLVVPEGRLV